MLEHDALGDSHGQPPRGKMIMTPLWTCGKLGTRRRHCDAGVGVLSGQVR